jgi:hypothetical protein
MKGHRGRKLGLNGGLDVRHIAAVLTLVVVEHAIITAGGTVNDVEVVAVDLLHITYPYE